MNVAYDEKEIIEPNIIDTYYYKYTFEKVTGRYKYASDYYLDGMLYGAVLRAGVPHAIIDYIDVSDAYKVPGVKAAITYRDVPGLNAFGYYKPNQPVLCKERVRYVGDAIAAVAAETQEAAEEAARSIKVRLIKLDGVYSIDYALKSEVILGEKDNIAYRISYENGSYEKAQGEEYEGTYEVGSIKQMYIEPESALAWIEDSNLKIITTTQSPDHDIEQISVNVNVPKDRIKLIFPDPGGAFGGKEEIHAQILASLLTLKTGRPVKLSFSREESNIATTRRISMRFHIKSKTTKDMKLQGLYVNVLAETGAYLSHAPIILEVAGSHAPGPYNIPNVKFEGALVYTNYPPVGGMRGYGASEVNFALERHLDEVIRKNGWDPFDFRLVNALKKGQPYGTGLVPVSEITLKETVLQAKNSPLLKSKKSNWPFIKVGVGIASGMKSTSYGQGGDHASVKLVLNRHGLKLLSTTPDMGTGIRFGLAKLLSERLNFPETMIEIENHSSDNPSSGTSNASRVLFMIGNASLDAANKLEKELIRKYGNSNLLYALEKLNDEVIEVSGEYDLPKVEGGVYKKSDIIFSFITAIARVEVDMLTGFIKVTDVDVYTEAGKIIFPLGYYSQIEGGAIMSLGYAIFEDLKLKEGQVLGKNFTTYILPVMKDIPKINVHAIEIPDPLGPLGAKGVGELPLTAIAPAIVNAVVDATGMEFREIPLKREKIVNH
ncbi:MAG: xanthine dehydrogenase family protein molybdopterin-binding subunit [Nitrososphaeria archaeon]